MAESRIGGSRKVTGRGSESTRVSIMKKRKRKKPRSRKAPQPQAAASPGNSEAAALPEGTKAP